MTTEACVFFIKGLMKAKFELISYEINSNCTFEEYKIKEEELEEELYSNFVNDDQFKYNYWWGKLEGNARLNAIYNVSKALYWGAPFDRSSLKKNTSKRFNFKK